MLVCDLHYKTITEHRIQREEQEHLQNAIIKFFKAHLIFMFHLRSPEPKVQVIAVEPFMVNTI